MFQVRRVCGRLVEARVQALANVARVDAYGASFKPLVRDAADRPILCADHRPVVIYSQPVADRLVQLFTTLNETWQRVAIIVAPTNATLGMQLQRIVRESSNPWRRVCFDAQSATAFLADALDEAERTRLASFLGYAG